MRGPAAMKAVTALLLVTALSGCVAHSVEAPKQELREPPINSLALEQCIGENGQENCADGGV
jgi:hypothetical protein